MNNQQRKERWIAALRSGEYPQHRGKLNNHKALDTDKATAFCCIGVLAKVESAERTQEEYRAYGEVSGLYPQQVYSPIYKATTSVSGRLVQMNDHENKSFSEIADYLESLG